MAAALDALFWGLLALAFTPWISPPTALLAGGAFALLAPAPAPKRALSLTKILLQASVVGLGFSMNLGRVLSAGSRGFLDTAASIAFALAAGAALGRLLRVDKTVAHLVSVGTAVCGGSAIAAVGPVIGADAEQMSVALGAVFLLNSVALLAFPPIGRALGLSQDQFGLWAALAIHDTSSVVGAAMRYGAEALSVGATVKLARALWIVPVCVASAAARRSKARIAWPWFIGLFVLAAAAGTYLPAGAPVWRALGAAATGGLTATLFLIGAGLRRDVLSRVGPRPLIQAVALWALVAVGSLTLIRAGLLR